MKQLKVFSYRDFKTLELKLNLFIKNNKVVRVEYSTATLPDGFIKYIAFVEYVIQ